MINGFDVSLGLWLGAGFQLVLYLLSPSADDPRARARWGAFSGMVGAAVAVSFVTWLAR